MAKVTPPADVFNEWTPQAQESYNAHLNSLANERDSYIEAANKLDESAAWHDECSRGALESVREERGPSSELFKDGSVGAMAGNEYVAIRESSMAANDREAAAAQREKANSLQQEIDSLTVRQSPITQKYPGTRNYTAENKEVYDKLVQAGLYEDRAKLNKLELKKAQLNEELGNTWFFTGDLKKQIAEVEKQIAALKSDISFNETNVENTNPRQPCLPTTPMPSVQFYVSAGAKMMCPFAAGNAVLNATRRSFLEGKPLCNINDCRPIVNIPSFGMCTNPANPQVASATAAAFGVLTPQPCQPNIVGPWKPGKPDVMVSNKPALLSTDTLQCAYGGVITILPG